MHWPNWRVQNQQMMYCFSYLQLSNPFTSPQLKNKQDCGCLSHILRSGQGVCDVTVPHPGPLYRLITCVSSCAGSGSWPVPLSRGVWALWVWVGGTSLGHAFAIKQTHWELDNGWVRKWEISLLFKSLWLYKPSMFPDMWAGHIESKAHVDGRFSYTPHQIFVTLWHLTWMLNMPI